MGNPNHAKDGKFTSGPNEANGSSYEQKVQKALGISVPKPKYRQVGQHIEIKEGSHTGEMYDNLEDYTSSVKIEDSDLREKSKDFFKSLNVEKVKYNDEWFEALPNETKELLRDFFKRQEAKKALNDMFNKPENKAKIMNNYKKHLPKEVREMVTEDDFEKMSFEDKEKYFNEGE